MTDWLPVLPPEVLSGVVTHLAEADISRASAVNSAWLDAFGHTVLQLQPQGSLQRPLRLSQRFPELQCLSMDGCVGVHVTDEQVQQVAGLRYLQQLSLQGCRSCTDASIAAVASLSGSAFRHALPVHLSLVLRSWSVL
jgi:hypothetical protein